MLCRAVIIRRALKMTGVQMVSAPEHHSHAFYVKSVTKTHAMRNQDFALSAMVEHENVSMEEPTDLAILAR